jgi:hypothetical protein
MTIAHGPDDLPEFDLTELERYLAGKPYEPPPAAWPSRHRGGPPDGRTRRVRRLAADVAEARQLVALQDTTELVTAHSSRVMRTIRRGAEAEKLVGLRQHPAFVALATVRARRTVTTAGFVALIIALGWSTASVQGFAAGGAPRFSPQWWFAWCVEPFVSLALLTIVIARAFLASRGQSITVPAVRRTEWLLLGATLLMNTWRHLPGVAEPFQFDQLIVHMLGPIVALCVVTVLPVLWVALDRVPSPHSAHGDSGPTADAKSTHQVDQRVASAVARAQELIQRGHLPPTPSANAVHKALGGAMDTARAVRDILRRGL